MAHEDFITLNGQAYDIAGPVSSKAISEFSAGFKIGKATYDDREHAFYIVLDDFSGGVGFHRIDVHEALGGIWDSVGGVDVRRANHITLPPERTTLTTDTSPTTVSFISNRFSMVLSDISGAEFLYAGIGNKIYRMPASRANFNTAATLAGVGTPEVQALVEWRDKDTNTRRLYAFTQNGALTSRYFTSTDGTTWTQQGRVVLEALVWDQKLVGSMPSAVTDAASGQTLGQIVASFSSDGINWDIDVVTAPSTTRGRPKFYFQGLPHWIGVAMAPWGEVSPYFLDFGRLYVLDFYKETAHEIQEVGDKTRLTCGVVYEGQIIVSDGYSVWSYDPGGQTTVRRIGVYNRFGVPPSMRGYTISTFAGGTSTLYALLDDNLNAKMRVLAYTGIGWAPLGPAYSTRNPIGVIVDRFPIGQSLSTPSRFLDVLVNDSELSTTIRLDSFKLPTSGDIPTNGDGFFEDGPLTFETGWMDGGFLDLQGALFRMHIDALYLSANETVQVEYRLDNNDSAAYTNLGTFNSSTGTLWFDAGHIGVQFRTVMFRVTLDRGGTNTATPELVALTLVYDKKPSFRAAWTFRIDVNRMVERKVQVGGVDATPLNIFQALQTTYNVKTLVTLTIPSVQPSAINVRVVDMPLTYDDFRAAVTGKGYIDISVLQPLGDPNP